MALVSPGVEVSIIDESQYAPTAVGTTAYMLIATAENKLAPGSTSLAQGTLATNAEEVYEVTSQRELVNLFGSPTFQQTIGGSPIHGDERNEYGLMAAYSLLGVSNRVFVQRADVDLGKLEGTTNRPQGDSTNGTYWLDTDDTNFGLYQWSATTNTFTYVSPTVEARSTAPTSDMGVPGDYIVTVGAGDTDEIHTYYKSSTGTWVEVGTDAWKDAVFTPSITSTADAGSSGVNTITVTGGGSGNITINGSSITVADGDDFDAVNTAINSASIDGVTSEITSDDVLVITATSAATNGNLVVTVDANLSTNLGIANATIAGPTTLSAPYFQNPNWRGNTTIANRPTGSIWQKSTATGSGLNPVVKQYSSVTETWNTLGVGTYANVFSATFALDRVGGGRNISQGTVFGQYDAAEDGTLQLYLWHRRTAGETVIVGGTLANATVSGDTSSNATAPSFTITTRLTPSSASQTTATITLDDGTYSAGSNTTTILGANIIAKINNSNVSSVVSATTNSSGQVVLTNRVGGDMLLENVSGNVIGVSLGITTSTTGITTPLSGDSYFIASNWQPLSTVGTGVRGVTGDAGYVISASTPEVAPANGTLWYNNSPARVDILINDGTQWKGYRTVTEDQRGFDLTATDPSGVIIATDAPTQQSDETPLVYGDLWLDSNDLENYPALYRWEVVDGVDQWVTVSKTDVTSPDAVVFADVRWGVNQTTDAATDDVPEIEDLLVSNHVDLDAPDPRLFPRGILVFNLRASGYGVKQWNSNFFSEANYPDIPEHLSDVYQTLGYYDGVSDTDFLPLEKGTWITVSGTADSGLPNFGRQAQRGVIVSAFRAAIDTSQALREETKVFNLIACPGYPELIPNMVALNEERDNTAFVVGDAPLRLAATGTAVSRWADNPDANPTGEKGLNTSSPYVGIYFPHGLTNDLNGETIVQPASHAVLRAISKSDQASYPWFAPAGTRRGLIDNFTAIGHIDADSGRFIATNVNPGLRDSLYERKINPLTSLPGTGLVIYGQKTLNPDPSALDRVNVARLVNFLRRQTAIATRPFIFEPNDNLTRNAVKSVVEGLLNDLAAKRGIFDYLVVCDTTNNTPDRIARNELYIDIAVQPVRAVEFIYIPIRIKNPGDLTITN